MFYAILFFIISGVFLNTKITNANILQPNVSWSFLGLKLYPTEPFPISLYSRTPNNIWITYKSSKEENVSRSVLYDKKEGIPLKQTDSIDTIPFFDFRGNYCGLAAKSDHVQLVLNQTQEDGSIATRVIRLPNPSGVSSSSPYILSPAKLTSDGMLILLGSGRDRFYKINPYLGEVKSILPTQVVSILDFDITEDGNIIAIDMFEKQVVLIDMMGELVKQIKVKPSLEGSNNYFFKIVSDKNNSFWITTATINTAGETIPEIINIKNDKTTSILLKASQGTKTPFPMQIDIDNNGGLYVIDDTNQIHHINSGLKFDASFASSIKSDEKKIEFKLAELPFFISESGFELDSLHTVINQSLPYISECYDSLLKISPKEKGKLVLNLSTIDRGFEKAIVSKKDFEGMGIESCLQQVFSKTKFPSKIGRQTFSIELDFSSKPLEKKN